MDAVNQCRQSVAQTKQKHSLFKARLSTGERGHHIIILMGDCHMPGFVPAQRFLWSQILCRLYKSPSDGLQTEVPQVHMHAKRSHGHMLKIL